MLCDIVVKLSCRDVYLIALSQLANDAMPFVPERKYSELETGFCEDRDV